MMRCKMKTTLKNESLRTLKLKRIIRILAAVPLILGGSGAEKIFAAEDDTVCQYYLNDRMLDSRPVNWVFRRCDTNEEVTEEELCTTTSVCSGADCDRRVTIPYISRTVRYTERLKCVNNRWEFGCSIYNRSSYECVTKAKKCTRFLTCPPDAELSYTVGFPTIKLDSFFDWNTCADSKSSSSAVNEAFQIAQERFDDLAASAELAINAAQALADQRQVQGPTNNGALNLTVEDFLNGLVFFGKGPGTTQEERIEDYERVIGGTDGGACTPINEEIIGIGDTKINTQ